MKKNLLSIVVCLGIVFFLSLVPAGAETGVTTNQITVGMSTVLTGPMSILGINFRNGVETCLAMVNEKGGVNGRKIKLIVYDDGDEPKNTVVNVNKLIKEDRVFCLLGNAGTSATLAIKPLLTDAKVPLFAPFTGAESLRSPVSKYILHYRASYNQEVEVFIQGMVDALGYKKVAVFYQDDAFGKAVLDATRAALKNKGLTVVATGAYTRNVEDVYWAQEKIMTSKPDAVVMAGTYSASAKFITDWKRKSILEGKKQNPVFMNVSFVGSERLAEMLDKYGENVVVTQVVPPIYTKGNNYPAVTEYLATLNRYFPGKKPTYGGLEGYLATKVFVEILKRTGKDVTREAFIQAAERTKDLDLQAGNTISFSDENHQGSQTVYPMVLKDGSFTLIQDWNIVR